MRSPLARAALAFVTTAAFACSRGAQEDEKVAWTCTRDEVPMGSAVRCSSAALTADAEPSASDTSSESQQTWTCGFRDPSCPPEDATGGGGAGGAGDATEPPTSTQGGTVEGSPSGGAGSSVPTECAYAPDLDYCPPSGSEGGTVGDPTCTKGNGNGKCNGGSGGASGANGSTSGNNGSSNGGDVGASSGSSGATSSSGASGSSGSSGGGTWTCHGDRNGKHTCERTECVPGTHPSPCGACIPDGGDDCDCVPPKAGGCWVTGGGFVTASGRDNFGGNAKPRKDGTIQGQWNHVDHGGRHVHGPVRYLVCREVPGAGPGQPGGKKGLTANQVLFGGPARVNEGAGFVDGYWYDVVAEDHGEPGRDDAYTLTLRKEADPATGTSGAVVYTVSGKLTGGNVQIHAPNNGHPYTPVAPPSWVSVGP
jgi:hypothetical protein